MPPLKDRISVIQGDITKLDVDAITNAANEAMLGGGGVDGAIHRASGPLLLDECRKVGGCPTGEARITGGYNLPAKYIIHTVGPVWDGGGYGEPALLASCYQNVLSLAEQHEVKSIAFPCISTGVYGYPKAEACDVAVSTTLEWLGDHVLPERVIFCCFGDDDYELYQRRLQA